jgi:phthalate 4,5-dioxygenase
MLKTEENERLTQVGPGTPMGAVMRKYWMPACLSEELAPGGSPRLVRLVGQRLVAFRSPNGKLGMLDEWCPHRAASLLLARNEDCGLRCLYHGWQVDRDGSPTPTLRCSKSSFAPTGPRPSKD